MEKSNKLIVLWTLLILGMILHFNYHVGEIFYGVDVVKPGYDGKEPNSIFVIRNVFYHLPVIWILVIMYAKKRWITLAMFIVSCFYFVAHIGHLIGEISNDEKNPSQLSLLILVFVIAGILVYEHLMYWRKYKQS